MRLTAILAVSRDGKIGDTTSPTGMPWPRLARDMKRFRDATMGKVCVVGRKTYDLLPPLKGRRLAVVTRQHVWPTDGPKAIYDAGYPDTLVRVMREHGEPEVMVIGGAEVYRALLPQCDRILLTEVHATYPDADVRLGPPTTLTEGLLCLSRETFAPDEANPLRVTFSEWVKP